MGYKKVYMPNHPNAMKCGSVYEHRLIMELKLGRYLEPGEQVHHKDGDKTNNEPSNLALCPDQKSHSMEHAYDSDELIRWLIQYAHEYGRFPTKKECDQNPGMPHSSTYIRRFGSWSAAKGMAMRWNEEIDFSWREEVSGWY